MSRGNSGDKISGQIPEDQVDKIRIKQLEYKIELLERQLFYIDKYVAEVCPWNEVLKPRTENAVHSVCSWLKHLLSKQEK